MALAICTSKRFPSGIRALRPHPRFEIDLTGPNISKETGISNNDNVTKGKPYASFFIISLETIPEYWDPDVCNAICSISLSLIGLYFTLYASNLMF